MDPHGAVAQREVNGDLFVRLPFAQRGQHVEFAFGEASADTNSIPSMFLNTSPALFKSPHWVSKLQPMTIKTKSTIHTILNHCFFLSCSGDSLDFACCPTCSFFLAHFNTSLSSMVNRAYSITLVLLGKVAL